MKYLLFLTFLLLPTLSFAIQYTPIQGLPGVSGNSFDSYINTLYGLSISIAALLAVIKIVIAGVKYMLTDIVTSKGEAKNDIKGALLGLLVVLGAVLILTVINPNLNKVNLNLDTKGVANCTNCITDASTEPLDPSSVSSTGLGLGASTEIFDHTKGEAQFQAFIRDCTSKGGTPTSGGVVSKYEASCIITPPPVKRVYKRDIQNFRDFCNQQPNSQYTVDPRYTPKMAWCVYPK